MNGATDDMAHVLWIMLALVLVGSSLVLRRQPLGRLLVWAVGWAALFGGVAYVFSLLQPEIIAWQQSRRGGTVAPARSSAASPGATATQVQPGVLHVPMSEDGHFWVDAQANGQSVRLLIDSGASITAISEQSAQALGLPPDPMSQTVMMNTANGSVSARRSSIASLALGPIVARDLPVVVSASFGSVNVLGMNFLSKLKSWRVEGQTMILEAQ